MSYSRFVHAFHHPCSKQRGAAFIVMLVIMVLGVTAVLVGSLNSAGIKIERDVKTTEALSRAKEALIGKSVIYEDYPGSLPCPDTDNDGEANGIGGPPGECPQYIGRLPWKTLGIPDLRDSTGERLWYTLSRNVRRYDSVRPLNSDTTGTLIVAGTFSGSNLLAIVFAPGSPVSPQVRGDINTACTPPVNTDPKCMPSNYLEGTNANPSPGAAPNVNYQSSNSAIDFNDQLIAINHDQLFATVEKRVGGEFRRHLNNYHASWGAFPFAAPFANPATTANYRGAVSTYEGLYPFGGLIFVNPVDNTLHPIGSSPPNPEWASSPAPTISFSPGPTPSFTCERRDSDWANSRVRCTADSSYATLAAGVTVTMTAKLADVGRGFWKPFSLDTKNLNFFDSDDEQVRVRDQFGNYQLAETIFDPGSVSVTGTLNYSDGSATVVFSAKGKTGGSRFERIDLRNIEYEQDTLPYWIESNEWGRLLYYAVSPDNAPAGSGGGSITCSPSNTPPCLILDNVRNDVKAMIITTGRTIAGVHPSGNLNDYLEGQNLSADYTFENQIRSSSFNDQVIIVAP